MTTGHVFIATSLDGFVARQDHSLDWLHKQPVAEDDDGGFAAFMDSVDGLVMGTGSFRTLLGFGHWPYTKPVVVLSSSLTEQDIPEELKDKVRLSTAAPADLMQKLQQEGWTRAYIDGGRMVQSFLRQGLIADLTITTVPILIGSGIPLFGSLDQDIDLQVASSRILPTGMVQTTFRVA
ncbi:dihydrofolate reductase family protein [Leisingera sp. McT4-56]|uniref:dihydrofolate reductase family protein n=1 Tax=Leisingera sp. McT4-56 TaxID=2881255 RepID=UPI001CF83B58|nr:dihydrofolate reductase family protein [Leisingera sp. McT4-56]MCB4454946.1 dihydrofolate reductase family protein [Leisingera sp. McT4-56]